MKEKIKTVFGFVFSLVFEFLVFYCACCVFSFSIAVGYVFPKFGIRAIAFAVIALLYVYRKNIIGWFKKEE